MALASFLKSGGVPRLLLSTKLPPEQITVLRSSPPTLQLREISSRELKRSIAIINPQASALGALPSMEGDSHLFWWWPNQAQDVLDPSLSPLRSKGISLEKSFYYFKLNTYKAKLMTCLGNDIVILLALMTCSNATLPMTNCTYRS